MVGMPNSRDTNRNTRHGLVPDATLYASPRLPHPYSVEEVALLVIKDAHKYEISDPAKLAAAYRVVERNNAARTAMYGELLKAVS